MLTDVNSHLKTIFENANEGFVLLDFNLKVQAFNAKAREIILLNTDKKEVHTGSFVFEYVDPSRLEIVINLCSRVLLGESVEYDYAYHRKDGTTAWFHFSYIPVREENKVAGICILATEITSRKIAEDQQALLVSIVNSSDDAIISIDTEGFITSWNGGAMQILGYEPAEAIGKPIFLLIPPALKEEFRQILNRIKTGQSIKQFETQRLTRHGKLIDVSISLAPIKDATGTPIGVATIVRDISEMKRTQEALKESEGLYRSLFENSPMPKLINQKSDLRLVKVNRMAVQHYGYSEKELLSMTAFDLRIREEHGDLLRIIEEGSQSVVKNKIVRHRKKNGQLIYVQIALHDIQYMGEPCYLVLVNDLTEQLRLQKELSDAKLNRQKEITKATIGGQEKQRAQIGKELHDNVNQMLASAKMYVSSIQGSNARQVDLVQRSLETISSCMEEIRMLSRTLVPPSLGDIGLVEAVDDLIQNLQLVQNQTTFSTHTYIDEQKLTEELKLSVYRIIQEQLSNVMKHAEASHVALQIKHDENTLHLVIADDGKGFDTTQKRNGIGLTNIINRAELHNGTVEIISSPGKGCTLRARFDPGEADSHLHEFE